MVIDFHSHILPGIDDGSRNSEMSLEMLRRMRESGVDLVIATPHFYGSRRTLEQFLERRSESARRLLEAIENTGAREDRLVPEILLGAEVAFYSGLTRENDLDRLCISGTNTLLLEMPFSVWTDFELNEVSSLCLDRGLNVVIAHLERYVSFQPKEMLQQLQRLPVYVQINAGTLLRWQGRRQWLRMFKDGEAKLLGSDAHNLTERAPNLAEGREVIKRKLGQEVLDNIDSCARSLISVEDE